MTEAKGWAVVGPDGGLYVAHTGRPIVYAEREDAAGWLAAGYTIQPVRITTAVECVWRTHAADGGAQVLTNCTAPEQAILWMSKVPTFCPDCGGKVRVE